MIYGRELPRILAAALLGAETATASPACAYDSSPATRSGRRDSESTTAGRCRVDEVVATSIAGDETLTECSCEM